MKHKTDVSRSLRIVPDKILIPRRPLLLCITCEHTLQTNTHALDIMHWAPPLSIEQVKADDAVGVDVRVPWNGVRLIFYEDYFGSLDSISYR
jgi:hypothetical protein